MKEKIQGKSIKNKLLRLLKYVLFVILGLPLVLSLLFKQPFVQSMAARRLADVLSSRTHVQVTVRSLKVDVLKGFVLQDLFLSDSMGSPMLHIGNLHARIKIMNLLRGRFRFRSVSIDTADFRLLIHKGSDDYAFVQFINSLSSAAPDSKAAPKPFVLQIKRLSLNHIHFQLHDENVHNKYGLHNMDYDDLDVGNASIKVHDFHLVNDSLNFYVDALAGREKSGFILKKMQAHLTISRKAFYFKDFIAETNHSKVAMDYAMDAAGWDSYAYFIDSVKLHVNFKPSVLYMPDIGYFANSLFAMKDTIRVNGGRIHGTLSNLLGHNLLVNYGSDTHFSGDIAMSGLTDFYTANIKADIKKFATSTKDVNAFILPNDSMPHLPLPVDFPKDEVVSLHGDFKGSFYHFVSNLFVQTADGGQLEINAGLKSSAHKLIRFRIILSGKKFPLGKWLAAPSLIGSGNFQAQLIAGRTKSQRLPIDIHLNFDHLLLNQYPYKNIGFKGKLLNDSLFMDLNVADPHLVLDSKGYVLLKKHPLFNLSVGLRKADFKALNIWPQKDFHLSTTANLRWEGLNPDSLSAHIDMTASLLQFGQDSYPVKKIILDKFVDSTGENIVHLQSDVLDMKMNGHFALTSIGGNVEHLFNQYFPAFDSTQIIENRHTQNMSIRVDFYKPEIIGEHFVPGLVLSPNTWFTGSFNFIQPGIEADAYSKKLQYQGIDFKENKFKIRTDTGRLLLKYNFLHLILKDSTKSDKSVFGIDSVQLGLALQHDSLGLSLQWHNQDSLVQNRGNIRAYYLKSKDLDKIKLTHCDVLINDSLWQIDYRNNIQYKSGGWQFKHFLIHSGKSQVALEGRYPKEEGDSLNIAFRQWNLSNLDLLWRFWGFDLDGIIDGDITSTMVGGRQSRIANLTIRKFALNHTILGSARVLSTWDNINNSVFIKSQIIRKENTGQSKIFSLDGFYFPYRDTSSLDLKLAFSHFDLKSINPLVAEYVSQIHGMANGELNLQGTPSDPDLTGFVNLKRTSLVVNYLNNRYSFSQKILFKKNYIDFGSFTLYDTLGNQGVLTGYLGHRYFHDAKLNLQIKTNRLLFFNTTRRQNDLYYGQAFASGKINITGPLNDITLNIDVASEKGTSVILPLDYSTEIPDKDYIIFKLPQIDSTNINSTETILNLPLKRQSQYTINLNMSINPNASLKIYLPSNLGDLESSGSGVLSLKTNSSGDLSLIGDYVVDKGAFNFSLANLVKKHFELVKGGRISFTGDLYKATVNIKGLYKVKANLGSLGVLIDSTTTFRNRVNVDCYVVITQNLFNPTIRFEIKFPDLDPDLQRMVYSQLDTTNQAVLNEQMISLLALGAFNFNNAAKPTFSSASSSLLSNQLSGMLSKISKDFDVGLNYKPGDNLTQEEFDVALSTQLFDERLIINGNFGMSYDRQNQSANNLVGDVDVGYKLTKDGRWLLKAYNHSNVNSWYYYNNYDKVSPYTQGVGIAYQKNFNKLTDLFKKKLKKKK